MKKIAFLFFLFLIPNKSCKVNKGLHSREGYASAKKRGK